MIVADDEVVKSNNAVAVRRRLKYPPFAYGLTLWRERGRMSRLGLEGHLQIEQTLISGVRGAIIIDMRVIPSEHQRRI